MKCCKGCTERWVTATARCHSTCERYNLLKEVRQKALKVRDHETTFRDAKMRAVEH